jgi:hypothetical protein
MAIYLIPRIDVDFEGHMSLSTKNEVSVIFVSFPDSGLSGVDDGSIQTQRAVKGLFDTAKTLRAKSGTV